MSLQGNSYSKDDETVKTASPKKANYDSMHDNYSETSKVVVDGKGGTFNFTKNFVCLGANACL